MNKDSNTVDVALIDTGIKNIQELKDNIIKKILFIDCIEEKMIDHGTVCAKIIREICPYVMFWDLQIFRNNGRTEISTLLDALEWCINHKIKLVHLSLGSINYFDKECLMRSIARLNDNGTLVVAAYHNLNIKSYPATFPRVFGVRQDREEILKNYEFTFQEQDELSMENTLVARYTDLKKENLSNSYAAPVITGHIANFLKEYPEASFEEILALLKKRAIKNVDIKNKIKNVLEIKREIDIPVICGNRCPEGGLKILVDIFRKKGYKVLFLQEILSDKQAIPIREYWKEEIRWKEVLSTLYFIYDSDIIILDVWSKNQTCGLDYKVVDIFIECDADSYLVNSETLKIKVKTIKDVYQAIYCRFHGL